MKQKVYTKDIILILTASFFFMASPMLVTPLITGFSESLGASAGLMGIIGGLMNLCSLFCRPLAGNLADKISKYKLSFIGAVMMVLACLGYVAAANEFVVVISRIINGVGFACCSVCMTTWMSNMLPRDKVGSGMGLYGTMNALAMAIAPSIGVSVYQVLGYRTAFGISLFFAIAVAVVIQFVGDKGEPEPAADTVSLKENNRIHLVDVKVLPIAFIIMLFTIPYCATQSFLVSYASARELSITVSLFFPVYAAALLILRLSLKSLFDKLPFKVFLTASSICAFLAITLMAVMKNNVLMFLASFFMAGGYGIMCSVCQSTAMLLAGKEKRGLANSTYYIGLDLGMTLGPMIGGVLYGSLDIQWFYPVLLITVPLVILVYLTAGKNLRKHV